ncbi:MAG TPA: hypothetical protein VMD91_08315 [Candidatus Sulfotelmatobacter sp.]|nr:hypothetical protein [Candidatus Sulfotelmatobacter sp.]
MGQGGEISLVNGTSYAWQLTYQHHYQMNAWTFPSTIAAQTVQTVYVEWDDHVGHKTKDDGGEATYTLVGTPYSFQIQARGVPYRHLQVQYVSLPTENNPPGEILDIGWVHDGTVPFVLAGQSGSFASSSMPVAWMQANFGSLGARTLRTLCIPGSHDAGMSTLGSHTVGVAPCNVLTQTTGIGGQLLQGSRYFDIRPVIAGATYQTGHYSSVEKTIDNKKLQFWVGGNGQAIADIVNDINAFTSTNKELVILNLSHDLNTDVGNANYRPFTQTEWNGLFQELLALNNRSVVTTADLTQVPINQLMGNGKAGVVLIVRPAGDDISLGSYANQGFYTDAQCPIFDSYSNTENLQTMISDQLQKMRTQRTSPTSPWFLLSWTLTQGTSDALTCASGGGVSIIDLADSANPRIYSDLYGSCTSRCYPNILYIDDVKSPNIAALAMAINAIAATS